VIGASKAWIGQLAPMLSTEDNEQVAFLLIDVDAQLILLTFVRWNDQST